MIECLTAKYVRNGVPMSVEFTRKDGFWGAELWIEEEYQGLISDGRSTDLDIIVREAGRYMEKTYPFDDGVVRLRIEREEV